MLLEISWRFEETYSLNLQDRRISQSRNHPKKAAIETHSSTKKIEAIFSPETSVDF
jgi:hypothetical protein